MAYDNVYNRRIADQYNSINQRYATLYAYSPVDGQDHGYAEGGSSAGVLFQTASASKRDGEDNMYNNNRQLPAVYYLGNDSEGLEGGSGFAKGTFRDTGYDRVLGAGAEGMFDKNAPFDRSIGGVSAGGISGGNIWDTLGDIGNTALKFAPLLLALGKPEASGKEVAEALKGSGMSGGRFWDDFLNTIGTVADVAGKVAPIAMKVFGGAEGGDLVQAELSAPSSAPTGGKKRGRPKGSKKGCGIKDDIKKYVAKVKDNIEKKGGAILGNPDGYPRMGNSVRLAGRGKVNKNGDLLAMPSPDLANGVPPTAQLQGSYGGSKEDAEIIEAVKAKIGSKGKKILPGATLKTGDGRKARADIVKRIMKEKGMKMIDASRYVKANNLYTK